MKNNERVLETRTKLIDGAISSLSEIGYHRTTFLEVARRSGLSRGAIHHHFESIPDLMTVVTREIATRIQNDINDAVVDLPEGSDIYAFGIDLLWQLIQNTPYRALEQLRAAVVTEPELRNALVPEMKLVSNWLKEMVQHAIANHAGDEIIDFSIVRMIVSSLIGTGSYDIAFGPPPDDPDRSIYLNEFKQLVDGYLESNSRANSEPAGSQ